MKRRVLSIGLVIMGLICVEADKAQAAWILVTGKGYPPRREISEPRKRLLARRAAVVDAYRLLTVRLNSASECIVGGTGHRHISGFIKGAEIKDVRYFPDGKVEVDMVLPLKGGGVCVGQS